MYVFLSRALLAVLGLIFGSFIAAFTYRYPRRLSVKKGRSFCDVCKTPLSWYDNLPVLSFFLLWGKCRVCKKRISFRYPLIELITMAGFLAVGFNLFPLIVFCLLAIIFILDYENKIIPDEFVFWGMFFSLFLINESFYGNFFAGFLMASFLMLIHLVTKGRGMGLGDVKFAVLGGMIVGPGLSAIWMFLAFLTGAIVAIILILVKGAKMRDQIAFGPFLVLAVPITLIWGEKIIQVLRW